MTRKEWMEEVRDTSQKLLKLIVEDDMDVHVKTLEKNVQIKHIARDLAMIMVTMNKWIARYYYHE